MTKIFIQAPYILRKLANRYVHSEYVHVLGAVGYLEKIVAILDPSTLILKQPLEM